MTTRYVAQPRSAHFWDGEDCHTADRLSIEVHSADQRQATFTGILTANGDQIMRLPDTVPIGFHRQQA